MLSFIYSLHGKLFAREQLETITMYHEQRVLTCSKIYNNFICNNQWKKAAIREELNPHVREFKTHVVQLIPQMIAVVYQLNSCLSRIGSLAFTISCRGYYYEEAMLFDG